MINGNDINGASASEARALPCEMQDPPCIVGMGCHLPGGVRGPSALWDFLIQRKSAQGRVPAERFNIDGFYRPDGKSRAGVVEADGGYFLDEDIRQFDNRFFGINNLEAIHMDPQQRKLLEVVYECFEGAGVSMDSMSGSNTGVYVGNFTLDFQTGQLRDPDYIHRYHTTGIAPAVMANRISYIFNLQGPSVTLDTACSSSMYALHSAVQALKNGECQGAIVASANLIGGLEQHFGTIKGGVISPTSTCHTFDESADGYGRGEAANAIYIKKLSTAIRDGDTIRAVIRGTAINSDGRTPGITQPSSSAQETVIRRTYQSAGLHPSDIDYIECHGTGTPVGDPIEVAGIGQAFSRKGKRPLMIGSVKTNFGHSEAASAITSIIKVVLALENGVIPPTYGVKRINPKLQLERFNLRVLQESQSWPRACRRASINSFGFGGANGHAILESFETFLGGHSTKAINGVHARSTTAVLPVSAASTRALQSRLEQISEAVCARRNDLQYLDKLAFTLAERRSHFRYRSYLLAKVRAEDPAIELSKPAPTITADEKDSLLPIAFVCTGQGAQYPGMAKELLRNNRTFAATIHSLDNVLQSLPKPPDWTLAETILDVSESDKIHLVTRSQPLCTAIQVALINMLSEWKVLPIAAIGHSSGEIAAAYASGLVTAEQAILTAFYRGYAVSKLTNTGLMMAAGCSEEVAAELIEEKGLGNEVRVACVNSPKSVTLSGSPTSIEDIRQELEARSVFARMLETNGRPYHSQIMEEVGPLYEELLIPVFEKTKKRPIETAQATMYSSVGVNSQGLAVFQNKIPSLPQYWRDNLEKPVQFGPALEALATKTGRLHVIEIGPHSALKGPIDQIRAHLEMGNKSLAYNSTIRRKEKSDECMLQLAGDLFQKGHQIQWSGVNGSHQGVRRREPVHDLPPYPWDYSSGILWTEPRASYELRNRQYARHELLGSSQLAGNGIEYNWRNVLQLSETSWLRDHKVESQIVFPAAGHLCLAIEGLKQILHLEAMNPKISYTFRNVNVPVALVVPENNQAASSGDIEIHTSMKRQKLSAVTASQTWFEFTVSSWNAGKSTLHCAGEVSVQTDQSRGTIGVPTTTHIEKCEDYEERSMGPVYEKMQEEGLCYGPSFRSLTRMKVDSSRVRTDGIFNTLFTQDGAGSSITHHPYDTHPIIIDACLQAAITALTAGQVGTLKALLPVFISKCQIRPIGPAECDEEGAIHTRSEMTSPGTIKSHCTLVNNDGHTMVNLEQIRLTMYSGKRNEATGDVKDGEPSKQRNPCLRVNWKPDILRASQDTSSQLRDYIAEFTSMQDLDMADNPSLATFGALLDLAGHKTPRMRILELGGNACQCNAADWKHLLGSGSEFARYRSWSIGELQHNGVHIKGEEKGPFDVVMATKYSTSSELWDLNPEDIMSLLNPNGIILFRTSSKALELLAAQNFQALDVGRKCLLAIPNRDTSLMTTRSVVLLVNTTSSLASKLANAVATGLKTLYGAHQAEVICIEDIPNATITAETICISFLEVEKEFLATMSPEEMNLLRLVTNTVTNLLWLTGSDALSSNGNPNLTLASGLSRSLMVEQPTLRFSILDIGDSIHQLDNYVDFICSSLVKALSSYGATDDKEFIHKDGMLHISRFVPDMDINSLFSRRLESPAEQLQAQTQLKRFEDATPARLSLGKPGLLGSMYFQELSEPASSPPEGYVDIDVKAVSVNAKDIYTMYGRVETQRSTIALEFSGIVKAVGPKVDLQIGERVVALAPNHWNTTERVPAYAVHKMHDYEDFSTMAALPVVYCTAVYALQDRANLQAGESVLIHAGSGAFGIAAISLALSMGATVYTTAGSPAKREFLMTKFGLPDGHIFNSRDSSFASDVMKATEGTGVDVIVNSLTGDLLHDSWDCIAEFGRFVEIGKKDLVDAGKLDMRVFLRNATFTAFDLSELFYNESQRQRQTLHRLMKKALDLYRNGSVQEVPITRFDVSDIVQAYRHFSTEGRVGKIVISLGRPESLIPTIPPRYQTLFHHNKVYLLIGCLGGLGRSLSQWMVSRGARNFVFLGRSGCDRPSARKLVSRLQDEGATVQVIRGDVVNPDAVSSTVKACEATGLPIGGVIQAAMGLSESLFTDMTNEAWHTGIQPKWSGTWNLHDALEGHNMDFFLLTSSVSGSIGNATESNYSAANGFLDAFAQWRTNQGKPTVSVGLGMISEVGYLHENPDIEALVMRRGVRPLTEAEMLQVIDLALMDGFQVPSGCNSSHLLTGLEPSRFQELLAQGFDVDNETVRDPRTTIALSAVAAQKEFGNAKGTDGTSNGPSSSKAVPNWLKSVTGAAASALLSEAEASSLQEAILRKVSRRLSGLILLPLEDIDVRRPIAQYGVDSMLASEFRNWLWSTLKVDVPFLDLTSANKDLVTLADFIDMKLPRQENGCLE